MIMNIPWQLVPQAGLVLANQPAINKKLYTYVGSLAGGNWIQFFDSIALPNVNDVPLYSIPINYDMPNLIDFEIQFNTGITIAFSQNVGFYDGIVNDGYIYGTYALL